MPTISHHSVIIKSARQRQEFDETAHQELVNSIEARGLLHPIVLRREDTGQVLVAGERRLRAIREIFELGGNFTCDGKVYRGPEVPFTDLGELSGLEAEEAELDENLRRRDLTWQELAEAHARLHKLRGAQKAQLFSPELGLGIEAPKQTIADTALEIHGRSDGDYQNRLRKEVIVSKHLDNPEVAKAKSLDDAFKILKRNEERTKNIELAKSVGATYSVDNHRLFNVSCLDYMQELIDKSAAPFDVILTDPPYGMGADQFGDGGGKLSGIEHHYDDSYESWKSLMTAWTSASFIVCKPQAHAYVFCDFDRFHELKTMMQLAGWYVFRTPLIVHKQNSGRVPLPDRGPRRQYELILYAIKGNKPVNNIFPDVISVTGDENLSHGAQKPVALYQNLLQRSVKPGDTVVDFFAGTGPIFGAATTMHCLAVGCELNPEYYALSMKRISELKKLETPDLFGGL